MRKIIIVSIIFLVGLFCWAPWITRDYARNKVLLRESYKKTHSVEENIFGTTKVLWAPFVRVVIAGNNIKYFVDCFGLVHEKYETD